MGEPSFFVISDPFLPDAIRGDFRNPPDTNDLLSLMRGETVDVAVDLFERSGTRLYDVVWTGYAFFFLLSFSIITAMSDAGLSGWTSYPALLGDSHGQPYAGLAISGRCGPTSFGTGIGSFPAGARRVSRGLSFDLTTWDGSDIFMPHDHSAWVILSARATEMFRDSAVGNVDFDRIEDIEL